MDSSVTLHGRKAIADRTARGTWALHCALTMDLESGPTYAFVYGYDADEYHKGDDGQWRIRRMRYDNDMSVLGPGLESTGL